jgi:hypothetical protein
MIGIIALKLEQLVGIVDAGSHQGVDPKLG